VSTDALSATRAFRRGPLSIDLRAEGLASPRRCGQSGREPENVFRRAGNRAGPVGPPVEVTTTFGDRAFLPCTDSPSLHPRAPSAALRASSWLAPDSPEDLAEPQGDQTRDASDRRLPPEPRRETVPRAFPARCRGSRRVETARSLGLRAVGPGDPVFHDTEVRFGGSRRTRFPATPLGESGRGRYRPTAPDRDRASDTPVATSSSADCLGAPSRPVPAGGGRRGPRDRDLVKGRGSCGPGVSSVGRRPSQGGGEASLPHRSPEALWIRLRGPSESPDDAFTSSWAFVDPASCCRCRPTRGVPFARACFEGDTPEARRARPPFTCTATLFGGLRASVFKARCRLPTSATAYDVRPKTGALVSSQGRRPRPPSGSDASRRGEVPPSR